MTLNIKKERYKKTINEKMEISRSIQKLERLKSKNEKYEIYNNSIEKNIFKKIDNKINKNFDKIMGTVTTLLVLLFIGGMIKSKYKKSNKNEIRNNKIIIEEIEKNIGNEEEKGNEKIEEAKKMLEESLKDNNKNKEKKSELFTEQRIEELIKKSKKTNERIKNNRLINNNNDFSNYKKRINIDNYEYENPKNKKSDIERYMRLNGTNLCASYVKLVAQSIGYEFNYITYMDTWEMAYKMHKEKWNNETNKSLNLILLKNNIKRKYLKGALKILEKGKKYIGEKEYLELRKILLDKNYLTAENKVEKLILKKFNEMPNGTMLFLRNSNSKYKKRADNHRKNAPTHVIIKLNGEWRDYNYYNERIRKTKIMLKNTKMITHIYTPPKTENKNLIQINIPNSIHFSEGKEKLLKAKEFAQLIEPGMWQYLSYLIYESKNNVIVLNKKI